MPTQRMLTGDRPTGKLHVGHYVGSIKNRVELQHRYESFFIIADLHMLTTKNTKEDIAEVAPNGRQMVLDALAAGIEPELATFYLQSAVPEVCEINTIFQNLVSVPRLERMPSLKEMARDAKKEEMPYGLLGYPVLQAADILCVKAHVVPVAGNPVLIYHDVFNPDVAEVEDLKSRYREGKVGDVEVKEKLAAAINAFLDPMRERRARFEADSGLVDRLIVEGTEKTRAEV